MPGSPSTPVTVVAVVRNTTLLLFASPLLLSSIGKSLCHLHCLLPLLLNSEHGLVGLLRVGHRRTKASANTSVENTLYQPPPKQAKHKSSSASASNKTNPSRQVVLFSQLEQSTLSVCPH